MGTITCRNADAPIVPECSITGVNAAVSGDRVDVSFSSTVNGVLTASIGSLCYRLQGTTTWTETPSGTNAISHTVSLTNQADGVYEFQAKANINGVLCQSPIATYTIDDGTVVEPTGDCCVQATAPNFIFEAEVATIPAGSSWQVQSGGGSTGQYVVYNEPTLTINNEHNDVLKYYFEVPTTGTYELNLLSSGLYDTAGDKNNDVWIRVPGTGDAPNQTPTAGVWKKVFRSFANPPGWAFNTQIDPQEGGGEYYFTAEAGTKYCIEMAGRSGQFYVDRIALHLMGSGEPEQAVLTPCTPTTVTPPTGDINLTPDGKPTATGRFVACDLISLHYDAAPDPDDNHAIAAGACVLDCYGVSDTDRYCVAVGAHGLRAADAGNPIGGTRWGVYLPNAETVAQAAYGSGNWDLVRGPSDNGQFLQVPKFAQKWKDTIDAGCKVYVAEGGPSDFTAQVAQYMQNNLGCTAAELQQITVVQHSTSWNEANTDPGNLTWVKNNLNYVAIDNGNLDGSYGQGNTAFLQHHPGIPRTQTGVDATSFFNKVKAGPCGAAWSAAESAYDATLPTVIDFSDTVELLWILNISQGDNGTISNITDFCNTFAT